MEERYEDCERCGERYHGEYIDLYLRDSHQPHGELLRVCCPGVGRTRSPRTKEND